MYVQQSDACTVPNSATPMSPQAITDALKKFAAVNTTFQDAQSAFDQIIQRSDLNVNGFPLAVQGGIPARSASGSVGKHSEAGPGATPTDGRIVFWPRKEKAKQQCIAQDPLPEGLPVEDPTAYRMPVPPKMPPQTAEAGLTPMGDPAPKPLPPRGGNTMQVMIPGSRTRGMGEFSPSWAMVAFGLTGLYFLWDWAKKGAR